MKNCKITSQNFNRAVLKTLFLRTVATITQTRLIQNFKVTIISKFRYM